MWSEIRIKIRNNLTGILGTIAFHLAIAVILMIIKVSSAKSGLESIIFLDLSGEPVKEEILNADIPVDPKVEQLVEDMLAEARRNIPVNVATRMGEEISTEKYIEQLEKDLDGSRPDGYYQQQESMKELIEQNEQADMYVPPEKKEKEQENKLYEGFTTIYYSLENRYHLYLPVPVYKCEGAGEITVTIAVDQIGRVVQVDAGGEPDDPNELCFQEAAKRSALAAKFNADFNAPLRQKGSITYQFIAQ